ncbi:hypothetical protein MRX96_009202 [Rhipicephalus microplus]
MPDTNDYSECDLWLYKDHKGCVHGPFSGACMFTWLASGRFRVSLPVKRTCDRDFQRLGQLMTTLGRLPFVADQTSPNQPSYSTDKLQAADATLVALSPDPGNEKPPLDCKSEFLKHGLTSFVDSQESIKVVHRTVGTTPAVLPATRVHRDECLKARHGFRGNADLLAEDNRAKGGSKKEVNQHEGALGWLREIPNSTKLRVGGSATTSRNKERGLPPYIDRCSRHSCCYNDLGQSVPESADKATMRSRIRGPS